MYLNYSEELVDLLDESRGRWQFENDVFVFEEAGTVERFNSLYEKVTHTAVRIDEMTNAAAKQRKRFSELLQGP